jgi:hypothetical protein
VAQYWSRRGHKLVPRRSSPQLVRAESLFSIKDAAASTACQTKKRGDAGRVLHVEQRGAMAGSAVPYHAFEEELAERPELIEAGSGPLDHA